MKRAQGGNCGGGNIQCEAMCTSKNIKYENKLNFLSFALKCSLTSLHRNEDTPGKIDGLSKVIRVEAGFEPRSSEPLFFLVTPIYL